MSDSYRNSDRYIHNEPWRNPTEATNESGPPRIYLQDNDFTLYNGDAREVLSELPDESVHMCVTSPPFFGLRNYGCEGQIGLEPTPEDWVASLVGVFEQVRRVLRKDGTLWVECGDSYGANQGASYGTTKAITGTGKGGGRADDPDVPRPTGWAGNQATGMSNPYKPKDLIGQPFLLAFALREAGWYWRNVCIWAKPNPMPESVRDRFTVAHSYVMLFSKQPRYFFDAEAVREPQLKADPLHPSFRPSVNTIDGAARNDRKINDERSRNGSWVEREKLNPAGRNARSVWTIPTQPLAMEHYAAFPEALVAHCIKAGTSERGCCPECGAPWVRKVERVDTGERQKKGDGWDTGPGGHGTIHRNGREKGEAGIPVLAAQTTGWRPSCECSSSKGSFSQNGGDGVGCSESESAVPSSRLSPLPCTVLDPFLGSGTTALVARRLNRRCIGIELSEKYAALAAQRTQQLSLEAI